MTPLMRTNFLSNKAADESVRVAIEIDELMEEHGYAVVPSKNRGLGARVFSHPVHGECTIWFQQKSHPIFGPGCFPDRVSMHGDLELYGKLQAIIAVFNQPVDMKGLYDEIWNEGKRVGREELRADLINYACIDLRPAEKPPAMWYDGVKWHVKINAEGQPEPFAIKFPIAIGHADGDDVIRLLVEDEWHICKEVIIPTLFGHNTKSVIYGKNDRRVELYWDGQGKFRYCYFTADNQPLEMLDTLNRVRTTA